ncbi:MAG: excinuclease ABC subunit UvrC [Acutalibacteraceae bacterium]|nr:excinuclease ABC subunit UvrC [Acutalibacteraceae bacterium]
MDKIKELKAKANRLPQSAGVYIMKNAHGEIIYIGKAKALKNRVTQYFGAGNQHTEKVRRMVSNVHDFEYILCDSEFEALILENSLIKQNQPKYNILLKDDKGYHYIKITGEKWKKLTTSMQTDDKKAEYIGPYYSAYVVKETVDEVRRIFKLPDCNRSFDKPTKPCLNYHIGRCDAPCRNKTDIDEYLATLNSAVDFIKHGGTREMIEKLKSQMESAAERLDFEYAARLRDRIAAIEKLGDRQKVVMCTYRTQDVFAAVQVGESFCVSVLMFRNSRLTDKKHFFLEGFSQKNAMYAEFLSGYYSDKTDIPSRILIDELPEDSGVLTEWLSDISGRGVTFIVPIRGEQKALLDMCRNNAAENLGAHQDRSGREMSALNELAQLLALSAPPRIIESYDISNTAGSENVAGMVVFRDGRPYKAHYRKFKIKGFTGQDDYRSMAEVLDRRFAEYKNGTDDAFSTLPDLILLDGAAGQMSAVEPILKKYNVNVPLFGMVKDSKHRTRAIASFGGDISIKSNKSAFNLVTAIQDEVHRYAISYHKKRRTANMLSSELMKIEGVGKTRATALFKHFKTLSAIKCADVQTLAAVKGVGKAAAQSVYDYFHENNG